MFRINTKRAAIVGLVSLIAYLLMISNVQAVGPLNDTGIVFCGEALDGNNAPCIGSEPAGQDAHYGRDAAMAAGVLQKTGGGHAGFDYTKIANNGSELPASATLGSGPNEWACTRDNVTGHLWEVKVDDQNHLRHSGHHYSWFDSQGPYGNPAGELWHCDNTLGGAACNTENYVAAVNTVGLCGHNDWRMPSVHTLQGIVNYNQLPAIDTSYFPNTPASSFWSGSPYAGFSEINHVWKVNFGGGESVGTADHSGSYGGKGFRYRVRLMRGGQ